MMVYSIKEDLASSESSHKMSLLQKSQKISRVYPAGAYMQYDQGSLFVVCQ